MAKELSAIFSSKVAASLAVDQLIEADIPRGDISILMSDETRGREFGLETSTKAPEGATAGGVIGGALGGLAAALAAIGVVAAPGIGLVAAGPLVAALAGLGAGAAAGGLTGALIGLGIPEHEAKVYSEAVEKGAILVGARAHDDRADAAREILEQSHGRNVRG